MCLDTHMGKMISVLFSCLRTSASPLHSLRTYLLSSSSPLLLSLIFLLRTRLLKPRAVTSLAEEAVQLSVALTEE